MAVAEQYQWQPLVTAAGCSSVTCIFTLVLVQPHSQNDRQLLHTSSAWMTNYCLDDLSLLPRPCCLLLCCVLRRSCDGYRVVRARECIAPISAAEAPLPGAGFSPYNYSGALKPPS